MHRGKEVYPVLEWETKGKRWKAHYLYARNWTTGSEITVHYHVDRSWKLQETTFYSCNLDLLVDVKYIRRCFYGIGL